MSVCQVPKGCGVASRVAKKPRMMVAVYEVTETPKPKRHTSPIGSIHGTPIRICKGRLTAACNPGVCDCPDVGCKVRKKKLPLIWMVIKLAVFSYAVEEAWRFGVWSDADKTADLTLRYRTWAAEFFSTRNQTVRTPEEIYDMYRIRYNLKNAWNYTVIGINEFITSIPDLICSAIDNMFKKKEPEEDPKKKKKK